MVEIHPQKSHCTVIARVRLLDPFLHSVTLVFTRRLVLKGSKPNLAFKRADA